MMRFVCALALASIASSAHAGDYAIRDRSGQRIGTAVERPDRGYDLRDRRGSTVSRIDPIPAGRDDPRRDLSREDWWRARR